MGYEFFAGSAFDLNMNTQIVEALTMEGAIQTLQDYMFRTESITYLLIVAALIGITFFYRFLTERDDDES